MKFVENGRNGIEFLALNKSARIVLCTVNCEHRYSMKKFGWSLSVQELTKDTKLQDELKEIMQSIVSA